MFSPQEEAPPLTVKQHSEKEIYQAQLVLAHAKRDKKSRKAAKENINPRSGSAAKADSSLNGKLLLSRKSPDMLFCVLLHSLFLAG